LNTGGALILPNCNKVGMEKFLEEFTINIPERRHAALVINGAGWHDNLKYQKILLSFNYRHIHQN
jgi:hypothetical protein